MHLSRLTVAEMLRLSQTFLDANHPAYVALMRVPDVARLLPRLSEIHQVLVASQTHDDVRAGALQQEVTALDAEHDDLVTGLDHQCQSLVLLVEDEVERARWERLRDILLPDGHKMAEASYQAQAENAALLQHVLDGLAAPDKKLLKSHVVGKRSLYEIFERLIAVGKEVGQKEQERQAVPVAPTDAALQGSQQQWARTVGAMVAMLKMSELLGELSPEIKAHVLEPLRAVTERRIPRQGAEGKA